MGRKGRNKRREPETANITAATHDGRGIAGTEGKKVFVAGALEGETVTYIRRKFRRSFDEAELLDRIAAAATELRRLGAQVVEHDDGVSVRGQVADGVAADVTGAAGNQNRGINHGGSSAPAGSAGRCARRPAGR